MTSEKQSAEIKRIGRQRIDEETAMKAKGKLREAKSGAEIADARTQVEKFEAAAREHGTNQDEQAFKGVLRKLGKIKK